MIYVDIYIYTVRYSWKTECVFFFFLDGVFEELIFSPKISQIQANKPGLQASCQLYHVHAVC